MDLQENRDLILSALMKRTSKVLSMIEEEKLRKAVTLIQETIGNHDKRRCNEYLGLMYLMLLAGHPEAYVEQKLEEMEPGFKEIILTINEKAPKLPVIPIQYQRYWIPCSEHGILRFKPIKVLI